MQSITLLPSFFSSHPLSWSHLSYTEISFPVSEVSDGTRLFTGLFGLSAIQGKRLEGAGQLRALVLFHCAGISAWSSKLWREDAIWCTRGATISFLHDWQTLIMESLCDRLVKQDKKTLIAVLVLGTEIINQRSKQACIIRQIIIIKKCFLNFV